MPNVHIPADESSDAISCEIDLVINHRVDALGKRLRLNGGIKAQLAATLLETPQRTYLWVYLIFKHLDSTMFRKTPKGLQAVISTLPRTVNQAYERILEKSEDVAAALKAFSIMLAAERPLDV